MTKKIFIVLTLILTCSASQKNCDAYGSLTITE